MEDGKPVMGGPIFPLNNDRSEKSDYFNQKQTLLDMVLDASLDDCFTVNRDGSYDDNRSFERIIALVKAQGYKRADDPTKAVTTIKIDFSIANRIFCTDPNDPDFETKSGKYEKELSKTIREIWRIDPHMRFVCECGEALQNLN